jgi:Domain of unknown function (DUF1963)
MPNEPVDLLEQLRPWFEKHARVAWIPKTANTDGRSTASKFSGVPLLQKGEAWPMCSSCTKPLELLMQLNLAELPDPDLDFGEGILQLFYCVGPDFCASFEAFSQGVLCRIIQPDAAVPAASNLNQFPPKSIIGWEPIADVPSEAELERLGIEIDYDFPLREPPYRTTALSCRELNPNQMDKLFGWPCWLQSDAYPKCPECNVDMNYLLQIASEDNVPYMFSDCGIGRITQCPQHKYVLAFSWEGS